MKKKLLSLLLVLTLAITSLVGCTSSNGDAKEKKEDKNASKTIMFTDSVGRKVEIPANIEKIAPSGSLAQIVLFSVAPDKLVGLSGDWTEDSKDYVDKKYTSLPVFGQFYGKGDLNMEALAAAEPQVIIDIGEKKGSMKEDLDSIQEQTGIPTIFIEATTANMSECYTKLGEILNVEDNAKVLADYCKTTYDTTVETMKKIGDKNKVNLAYCVGDTGTNVIAEGSFHSEIINILANNVAKLNDPSSKGNGNEVSLEQLYLWNPDVIVFAPQSIYSKVGSQTEWQKISAISSGKYYEAPSTPYNWMGFPPSVNRYMGMIWLSEILYPEHFNYDLKEKTKEFYKLFYHVDLSDEQYIKLTKNAIK
ncbi:ABC transporter substrate-binding protein [Clostridioides sp. ES-S-0001-02]|uniref:ABC transporter substrate-binding protein n=1 Tax=Clostridioides sp. ES-S-0001-02 TaxID=2770770 RepID=UPI001D0FAD72|nr:ABC transporter substrate-binding protein [Clostridioides sp. ES-S-0001-02]